MARLCNVIAPMCSDRRFGVGTDWEKHKRGNHEIKSVLIGVNPRLALGNLCRN